MTKKEYVGTATISYNPYRRGHQIRFATTAGQGRWTDIRPYAELLALRVNEDNARIQPADWIQYHAEDVFIAAYKDLLCLSITVQVHDLDGAGLCSVQKILRARWRVK